MGFPWKKILSVGTGIASLYVPALGAAIGTIEQAVPDLAGPNKKQAAVAMAQAVVEAAEGSAGKDLVNDAAVQQATSSFVDAYVALMNAIAAAKHAKV